ncbi:MAG TPA: ZIP family metal transporter [Candidatus Binataceae bacterium]|nr:ZIP family metal transporter [Candidatus Binataceae bacterium]
MAILFACFTLISTGLGGLAAIRLRDRLHLLLGFSSGAVIAVALFDILPEIVDLTGAARTFMPMVAAGFLFFFALERVTALHRGREHPHQVGAHQPELGIVAAAGLALHSFLDGFAIGVGFQSGIRIGLLIALGVIAHDSSDGLNTVTVVLAHKNSVRRALFWLMVDMTTPVLGAIVATLFHFDRAVLPWMLAFFAGSFLYIGASDLLPEAREHDSPMVGVATAAGMFAMYAISTLMRAR